ncbi:hypothetical protein QQS21_012422 [Conoideocrella luteorostrata]|uniref:SIS domain-containing protein n=1 Tax=Conoideocrella luteorostrata TaxID=1105319 RepID=A0AAJ0CB75_9HYPO|nr:hypothetical protein QQS21_012422 [Conoideocrella luteorostrata]
MTEKRQAERRPIQTSAVIVLGAKQGPALPPPSPPTPCALPSDGSLIEPTGSFSLEQQQLDHHEQKADRLPCTPCPKGSVAAENRLQRGIHVLNTEAIALANLAKLYETDFIARDGFDKAVQIITRQSLANGKLVIIGVGKSGHIGKKLVATMQSLDIRAVFLHPTEALHGDLGIIDPRDTLMFITYSGKTQELMLMLPHLDSSLPTILLTSHISRDTCELIKRRPNTILLPAPVPEGEKASFGVPAPSTSTTVALALGDALAITAANELHRSVAAAFARNHPGGAIGAAEAATASNSPQTAIQICVPMDDIPSLDELGLTWDSLGIDLLRAGYDSKSGWVKIDDEVLAAPSQVRQISTTELSQPLAQLSDLFVSIPDMPVIPSDTTIRQAADMVYAAQLGNAGHTTPYRSNAIIGITEGGKIIGVLEARRVVESRGGGGGGGSCGT